MFVPCVWMKFNFGCWREIGENWGNETNAKRKINFNSIDDAWLCTTEEIIHSTRLSCWYFFILLNRREDEMRVPLILGIIKDIMKFSCEKIDRMNLLTQKFDFFNCFRFPFSQLYFFSIRFFPHDSLFEKLLFFFTIFLSEFLK